MDCSNTGIFK